MELFLLNITHFSKLISPKNIEKIPLVFRTNIINLVPKILKPTLSVVPYNLQKKILLTALHSVFKEAIADDDFEFLQDKWLLISVTDLALNWLISFNDGQLIMAENNQPYDADVRFSATSDDLLLIAGRKEDPDTLFFQRRLKIEGDTELGLEVKNLIDALDIDQLPSLVHKVVDGCATILYQTKHTI
jgi:predicted lipid carrier protein YhbT